MKTTFLTLLFVGLAAAQAFADSAKTLINVDDKGVALQGYDPVAFFTEHKPVKGQEAFHFAYQGATYLFSSQAHQALFEANPAHYAPQFGGFCAYGVSKGATAPIEVDAFQIVDGKLLLQYDKGIRDSFNENQTGNLKKAQENWPGLVEKKGK